LSLFNPVCRVGGDSDFGILIKDRDMIIRDLQADIYSIFGIEITGWRGGYNSSVDAVTGRIDSTMQFK
jgi:hypothetical protein